MTEAQKRCNPVTSAEKVRKHRALKAKRDAVAPHGIEVLTELIVLKYPDGYYALQEWTGAEWQTVAKGFLEKA